METRRPARCGAKSSRAEPTWWRNCRAARCPGPSRRCGRPCPGRRKKNGLVHRVLRLAVDRFEQNPRFVGAYEIYDGFSERLRFRFQMRIVQGVGDELAP